MLGFSRYVVDRRSGKLALQHCTPGHEARSFRNVDFLFSLFTNYESEARRVMDVGLPLPAYEMVLKAAHTFNLLDARGAISVTERAAYIGRIRNLARAVAQAYVDSRARLGFPMAPKAHAEEVLAQLAAKKAA